MAFNGHCVDRVDKHAAVVDALIRELNQKRQQRYKHCEYAKEGPEGTGASPHRGHDHPTALEMPSHLENPNYFEQPEKLKDAVGSAEPKRII